MAFVRSGLVWSFFCYYVGFPCHRPKFIALIGAGIPIFSIGIKRRAGMTLKIANGIALQKKYCYATNSLKTYSDIDRTNYLYFCK